ncbi:hypothetical protein AMS68_005111 [Peltaster fructicola]|uniref:Dipeptidyl-peptidase V n=1 Tax=Peltaster fructicola TaxID=286661 RepID=A0A6H0XXY5_9PEZI|nr:hypothetical protein AMS68_005111 [Peltaster fructicola]
MTKDDISSFITSILDVSVPSAVNLADNGKTLVYTVSRDPFNSQKDGEHDVASVWHAVTNETNSARQLTSGLYNDRLPALSPDGSLVVFTSDRAKRGSSSAIYALSLSGGEAYALTSAMNEQPIDQLKWSPDGRFIAFTSADEKSDARKKKDEAKDDANVWGQEWEHNRLRVLHVESRDIKTMVSMDQHVVKFDWSPDGKSLAFNTQASSEIDAFVLSGSTIYTVSADSSDLKKVAHTPTALQSLSYTADSIYFIGSVTPEFAVSAQAVYKIDVQGGLSDCKRIAHGDHSCALETRRAERDVAYYVQMGMKDHISIVDGGHLIDGLTASIKAWDIAQLEDSNGNVVVALVKGDINNPGEVYTKCSSDGSLTQVSNHGSSWADKDLAAARYLSCKSTDDTTHLEGVLFTPKRFADDNGFPNKPMATVVAVHGGPYYRITDSFNPSAYYFTNVFLKAGYAVMHPNYRGSSGRGEAFADKARGAMGVYDEPDVIALTQYCIEKGYSDRDQLIVSGWSQGGFLSYLCSVRNGMHGFGWRFKGAIPGAGVTDWDTMCFSSDVGYIEAELGGRGAWSTDFSDTESRAGSAIWHVKSAAQEKRIPEMLMLHGANDERVPIEQARAFRRALQWHKLPFEYVEYPREGHLIKERKHLEDMVKRSLRFVDQHLTKN